MKLIQLRWLFLTLVVIFSTCFVFANVNVGIDQISAGPNLGGGVGDWACRNSSWPGQESPPYKSTYRGFCNNDYSFKLLVEDPYWYVCEGTGPDSHYWFRLWQNSSGPFCIDDYSNNLIDYSVCDGTYLDLDLNENQGYYIQFDLYSQCTGCTTPPDGNVLVTEYGSWWSTKGTNPNPSDSDLDWLIRDHLEVKEAIYQDDLFTYDLYFIGSPNCTCGPVLYGCAPGETTG